MEDVFKAAIVSLQDGVLGAHVEGPAFRQCHLEGTMGKILDRLVKVVHSHGYTTTACGGRTGRNQLDLVLLKDLLVSP